MSARSEMLEDMLLLSNKCKVGETIRENHTRCGAGEDRRRRFYITRKPDILLGYCHNCQESVSKYVGTGDRFRDDAAYGMIAPKQEYEEPVLVSWLEPENIPAEADAWRIKAKLSRTDCTSHGISYSPEYEALFVPFVTFNTFDNGYQLRPLSPYARAKYVNCVRDEGEELGGLIAYPEVPPRTIMIVEDYASGIHVFNAGADAYVNYGTHVKPKQLYKVAKHAVRNNMERIVVWLDNDKPEVREKARTMESTLRMFVPDNIKVVRYTDENEPKHCTPQEIIEWIA